jgi:uncharacterized membrane protein YiaA
MEDKIQAFRQPMVTATGIILGFVLNFVATWVKTDSLMGDGLAYLIGICVLAGSACLILVLFRVLNMDYPREQARQYYHRTLALFIAGITLAFLGVFMDMFVHFMAV